MDTGQIPNAKLPNNQSFLTSLNRILDLVKENPAQEIKVGQILTILADKSYEALLIVLSLPFCIPVQIPGVSTPFGILLGFIGFRIACGKGPWWPKWILERKVKNQLLIKVVEKTITVVRYFHKYLHPRLVFLTTNNVLLRFNGILIIILAFLLSLPLPIPMTNMLAAFPILCIGLGLLENDGLILIIGYVLALIYFAFLFWVLLFGISHLKLLLVNNF